MARRTPILFAFLAISILMDSGISLAQSGQSDVFSPLLGNQAISSGEAPASGELETWAVIRPLPSEANGAWELSGPSGTYTGAGHASIKVSPGTYTVRWLPTPGYLVPSPSIQSAYISFGSSHLFTGTFELYSGAAGTLVLDPNPGDLAAGWELTGPDEEIYVGSGPQTYENLPVGTYSLTWQPVFGYFSPDPSTVPLNINEDQTTTVVGEYVLAPTGDVVIDPMPSGLMAPWVLRSVEKYYLEGEGYSYVAGLVANRDYIIEWGEMPGFFTPQPDTAFLEIGGTLPFQTTFEPLPTVFGTVTIDSEPEYYPSRYWTLHFPNNSFISGCGDTTLTYLPIGNFSLVWNDYDSTWLVPDPSQNDFVLYDQNHVTVTGIFSPVTFGNIHIHGFWESELLSFNWTLEGPNGVFIEGPGDWSDSMMPVGHYSLKWQEEPGYIFTKADSVDFYLDASLLGQRHHHPYGKPARLYVDPSPHALAPGWRLTAADTNFVPVEGAGPTVLTYLLPGEYTVEWLPLEEWVLPSPPMEPVVLASAEEGAVRGDYQSSDVVVINVSPPGLDATWTLADSDTTVWTGTGDAILFDMEEDLYWITCDSHDGYASPDPTSTHKTLYSGSYIVFDCVYELDYPDLVAGETPHGIFGVCPDDTSVIAFDFYNSGRAPYTGPVTTEVWLSQGESPFGIGDVLLASQTRNMTWEPGAARTDAFTFTTPEDIVPGYYYLYYVVDTNEAVEETNESNNLSWGTLEPGDYEYFLNFPVADPARGVVNPVPGQPYEIRWTMPSYALGVEVFENDLMVYSGVGRSIDLVREAGEYTYRLKGRNRCGCGELSDPFTVTVGASNAVMIDCYPNHIDTPWTITGPEGFTDSGVHDYSWIEMPPGDYTISWGDAVSWDIEGPSEETLTLVEGESLTFNGRYGHSIFYYEEYYGLTPMYHPSSVSGGQLVYATDGANTFLVYDVSDPSHPQQVGSFAFGGEIHDFEIIGNFAYVSIGNLVVALNLSSPSAINPQYFFTLSGSNGSHGDIASSQSGLFVADDQGIHYLEILSNGSLYEADYFSFGFSTALEVYGNTLLVSIYDLFGVVALDISGGTFQENGFYYGGLTGVIQMQTVLPNYVYMINQLGTFHIASGANMPSSLSPVGTFSVPGMLFYEFHVVGDQVFIATSHGLLVLDVSDPANPVQMGLFESGSLGQGVTSLGSYTYLGVADGGTWVLEVAGSNSVMVDPNPDALNAGWTLLRPDGSEVTMSGDLMLGGQEPGAYTITWASVDDMASPPPMIQELELGGHVYFYSEYREVSAAEDKGIPRRFELGPAYPNPFNPITKINYALPKASSVSLKIYDISGKLVKTILDNQVQAAGHFTATWQGRDNNDRRVASGVYFYMLNAGTFNAVKKMTLLK